MAQRKTFLKVIDDERLIFATKLAEDAGQLALRMRDDCPDGFVKNKAHQDFVTAADLAVEKLIRARIAEAYPLDTVLGEEEGAPNDLGGQVWVVDPIDGTTNYFHGLPEWGVSIAFVDNYEITHGVIHLPDMNETASTKLGCGAFMNGKKMSVSSINSADNALIILGYSQRMDLSQYLLKIESLIGDGFEYRRQGSACFGLYSVAAGKVEAYFEEHLNPWDALAGLLLVSEAGGRYIVDPMDHFMAQGSPVIATNAHQFIFNILQRTSDI